MLKTLFLKLKCYLDNAVVHSRSVVNRVLLGIVFVTSRHVFEVGLAAFAVDILMLASLIAINYPNWITLFHSKLKTALRPQRIARLLGLLGLIFPPKDRETVWELPISDIIRDFKTFRAKYCSTVARLWIYLCLAFHVALTLCEATRVCIRERIARLLRPLAILFTKN